MSATAPVTMPGGVDALLRGPVWIAGKRRTGKTTLARELVRGLREHYAAQGKVVLVVAVDPFAAPTRNYAGIADVVLPHTGVNGGMRTRWNAMLEWQRRRNAADKGPWVVVLDDAPIPRAALSNVIDAILERGGHVIGIKQAVEDLLPAERSRSTFVQSSGWSCPPTAPREDLQYAKLAPRDEAAEFAALLRALEEAFPPEALRAADVLHAIGCGTQTLHALEEPPAAT